MRTMSETIVLFLVLIASIGTESIAEPDGSDGQFNRINKNRDEVKCYDETGKPQVSVT